MCEVTQQSSSLPLKQEAASLSTSSFPSLGHEEHLCPCSPLLDSDHSGEADGCLTRCHKRHTVSLACIVSKGNASSLHSSEGH